MNKVEFYVEKEVVNLLPVGRSTFLKLVKTEPLLKKSKIGKKNFWKKERVDQYLEQL